MPVVAAALAGSVILALIDPAWAVPAQTFLLIVLTVVTFRVGGNVKQTKTQNQEIIQKGEEIHEDVLKAKANSTHAASAAAAAAAVARDSSRIVKDVGKMFREGQASIPSTGPTGTTHEGGGH